MHYSAMEMEIHNGFLETLLSRSVCPGWSLYAKAAESGSGNKRCFVRIDHIGNRETDDIEFDLEEPIMSFLENCRGFMRTIIVIMKNSELPGTAWKLPKCGILLFTE